MSATELTRRLTALLRREHGALAEFLVALADFDRRRCWVELGHSSLFYFLHRELGLSKGAAYHRKVAAELLQRFPEVIEPLRDGRLCITSVVELAKVITEDNRADVVARFFHCSKREAMVVSAEIVPRAAPHRVVVTTAGAEQRTGGAPPAFSVHPDEPAMGGESSEAASEVPAQITGAVVQAGAALEARNAAVDLDARAAPPVTPVAVPAPAPAPAPDTVVPLTRDLRRLHVTVSRRFLDKLAAARDALSHARPGGTVEEVLESALDLLLQQHAKKKGLVERPRARPRTPSRPDHIPAAVKREVWTRDRGCCQWPLKSGGVCGSTVRVEFDHVRPRARQGPSTVENVRLLCKVHNQLAARRVFGDELVDRATAAARAGEQDERRAPGPS